jgi:hypothetical protein
MYRDSLTAFLRERLKDAQIEKEYRHAGTTIDIYVKQSGFFGSSEVFVELKRNLLRKTELDRLVGASGVAPTDASMEWLSGDNLGKALEISYV